MESLTMDRRGILVLALAVLGLVLTGVSTGRAEPLNVRDFGAVGDGKTDDAPALAKALQAGLGGTVIFPPGTYLIDTDLAIEVAGDLSLQGTPGRTVLLLGGNHSLTFGSAAVGRRRALKADAPRRSRIVALESVEGVEVGDVVSVFDPTLAETGWKRPAMHLSRVAAVDAENGTLTLAHPLNFAFTAKAGARATVSRPQGRLTMKGFDVTVGTPERSLRCMIELRNLVGTRGESIRFLGTTDFGHRGMLVTGCLDSTFRDVYFNRIQYGFLVNNSRHSVFEQIESFNSRHPVTPANWSDGIYVDGLRGNRNQGIMDAHPSFNIHYNNVVSGVEVGTSNLRSVGGSVRNSVFVRRDEILWGPYFQSVALVDPEIYADYEFLMENVHWEGSRPIAISHGGKVTLRNVRCVSPDGTELGVNVGKHVRRLVVDNTRTGHVRVADVDLRGQKHFNARPRELTWTDKDGKEHRFADGYVLDFENNLLTRDADQLYARGNIFGARAGEPVHVKLRIYDNYLGDAGGKPYVYGILKLKAMLAHSNTGQFDMVEHHYHFFHKRVTTRALKFGTAPVYASAPTGQPNATLEMELADPVQDANRPGEDRWLQVDIKLKSGRTKPEYQLFYEIELYGRLPAKK